MLAKLAYVTFGTVAALINGLDFSGTIGLGSIIVGMLVAIAAGGTNLRNRYMRDQIAGWKGNYEQEKEHATQLEARLKDAQDLSVRLRTELAEAKVVIERFQQLPNLERLITLMSGLQERQEERAQTRHHEILDAIKTRP